MVNPTERTPGFPVWGWILLILIVGVVGFVGGRWVTRLFEDRSPSPVVVAGETPTTSPSAQSTFTTTPQPAAPTEPAPQETPTPPVATVMPQSEAAATPCALTVDGELTPLYDPVLGCALDEAQIIWAAWERFERGSMLWRSDTDAAYLFFASGGWSELPERWDGQEVPGRGAPPEGLQAPARGFGYVWSLREDIFQGLGWALDRERGLCVRVQNFTQGFLLASSPVASCTADNLYNHGAEPGWPPLGMMVGPNGEWRHMP